MARNPEKPIAIKINGLGFSFTCPIAKAHISVSPYGNASFGGRDFYAFGDDVKQIDIVMLSTYKGATRYGRSIYNSLDYMRQNTILKTPTWGWIWEENESFNKEKRVAERKAKKAQRKTAASQTITNRSEENP